MPREPSPSLPERNFIHSALASGLRLDGRALNAYRELQLSFGKDLGATEAQLGKTRVAVRVSCTVVEPFADRKFDGIFTIATELSPMASAAFEVGRPTSQETLLTRLLEKALRRSSALDTESLCLIAGRACFAVRADVHVLAHDGNLIDCACVALVAALLHFRRPDATVEGESVRVWDEREREGVRLSLLHLPLCVSFSYFDVSGAKGGDETGEDDLVVLLDATRAEEQVRKAEVVLTMNRFGEVCQIAKFGGLAVDGVGIIGLIGIALEKVKVMTSFITEKVADDERGRDVGGLIAELSAENDRILA